MNLLWLDVETGGLIPGKNPVLTIGGIVEKNTHVEKEFVIKLKPLPGQEIDEKALEVNGITPQEIDTEHVNAMEGLAEFMSIIRTYYGKDKPIPAGHNVGFDLGMLKALFKACNMQLTVDYHALDTMYLAVLLKRQGHINIPNVKLATLTEYYGIPHVAHEALSDIRATRQLYVEIAKRLTYKES